MDSLQPPVRPFTGDFIGLLRSEIQHREQQMREDNARTRIEDLNGKSCRRVLSELLEQFNELDFRERAGLDEDAKLTRKIFVVIAVEEIISKATANNWGLCIKNDFIYLYNGRYWQPLNAEEFKPFLADAALKMGVAPLEAKYHQFKEEMYKQFVSEANMPTPERMAGITLINLQNGTFEISGNGQTLREQRREDFLKYQLPFEYDPSARCPLFDKYLQRVLPDTDCRKVLAEYMGYIFTTGLKLEKAAILYGSGANGKSVFFEVVNALIGPDNICSYSLQNLTKYDSYQRAELSNKLLNYASETGGVDIQATRKRRTGRSPANIRAAFRDAGIRQTDVQLQRTAQRGGEYQRLFPPVPDYSFRANHTGKRTGPGTGGKDHPGRIKRCFQLDAGRVEAVAPTTQIYTFGNDPGAGRGFQA